MKISILVATYKRPQFLAECLQYLSRQQRLPDEVVVVVRTEDHDTQNLLKTFSNPFPDSNALRLVYVTEPGIVHAENAGLAVVQGEVVVLIDDDAIATEDWLTRIEQHYQNPHVGAVGGPSVPYINGHPVKESITGTCMRKTWYGGHIGHSEKIPDTVREVHFLRGCNMSFRRALVSRFDERLKPYWRRFEDDAMLSILNRNYKIHYDPQIQVYHHTAPIQEGQSRDQDPTSVFGSHHNNTYVMLKHSPLWKRMIFLGFTFLVGDRTNPGIGGYAAKALVKRQWRMVRKELGWALHGKMEGIQTYREWKQETSKREQW